MAADLRRTLDWLKTIAAQHDAVLVACSGGKDSRATLDLCQRAGFKRVDGFAMYFLPDLRCFEEPIADDERRTGVKIHRVQHWMTANLIASGVFRPHVRELRDFPKVTIKDVWRVVRAQTGIHLIASGERANETIWRMGQMQKSAGYEPKAGRVFPVWDWSEKDVISYLRGRAIPVPRGLGKRNMSGLSLRADCLEYLRDHYPDDLAKIVKVFPFCTAQLARREYLAQRPRDAAD